MASAKNEDMEDRRGIPDGKVVTQVQLSSWIALPIKPNALIYAQASNSILWVYLTACNGNVVINVFISDGYGMGCIGRSDRVFVETEKPGVKGVRVRVLSHSSEVRVFDKTAQSRRSSLFADQSKLSGVSTSICKSPSDGWESVLKIKAVKLWYDVVRLQGEFKS